MTQIYYQEKIGVEKQNLYFYLMTIKKNGEYFTFNIAKRI